MSQESYTVSSFQTECEKENFHLNFSVQMLVCTRFIMKKTLGTIQKRGRICILRDITEPRDESTETNYMLKIKFE